MPTLRRDIIRGSLALLAAPALIGRAQAAEFSWKFGHTAPTDFPLHIRLAAAAAKIAEESGGRMELLVFPDGQLGGDNDLLSQGRSGAIEFCQPTGQIMASLLPVTAINALGFAFDGYDRIWPAMDGDLGKYVRTQITAKLGLVPMERMWNLGFRQITTSTKPIKVAGDLAGLKIRTPVAPSLVSLFRTLQAAPLALQLPEVYSALQTHIADAQENPLTFIGSLKFYEVQKYCSITNHVWDGHWFCANGRAWSRLPPDLQQIVARNLNEAALLERQDTVQADQTIRAELEAKGLVFNQAETESFRDGLRRGGFYKEWREKLGEEPWTLLEKYAGKLG